METAAQELVQWVRNEFPGADFWLSCGGSKLEEDSETPLLIYLPSGSQIDIRLRGRGGGGPAQEFDYRAWVQQTTQMAAYTSIGHGLQVGRPVNIRLTITKIQSRDLAHRFLQCEVRDEEGVPALLRWDRGPAAAPFELPRLGSAIARGVTVAHYERTGFWIFAGQQGILPGVFNVAEQRQKSGFADLCCATGGFGRRSPGRASDSLCLRPSKRSGKHLR